MTLCVLVHPLLSNLLPLLYSLEKWTSCLDHRKSFVVVELSSFPCLVSWWCSLRSTTHIAQNDSVNSRTNALLLTWCHFDLSGHYSSLCCCSFCFKVHFCRWFGFKSSHCLILIFSHVPVHACVLCNFASFYIWSVLADLLTNWVAGIQFCSCTKSRWQHTLSPLPCCGWQMGCRKHIA